MDEFFGDRSDARLCAEASLRLPAPFQAAAWRSTSQPLHASRTVRGTACSPLA
jgi:hypothetical protein